MLSVVDVGSILPIDMNQRRTKLHFLALWLLKQFARPTVYEVLHREAVCGCKVGVTYTLYLLTTEVTSRGP